MKETPIMPPEELSPEEMKRKKIRKFLLLFAALIIFNVFVWGSLYYATVGSSNNENADKITSPSVEESQSVKVPEESFPFEEMTIPFLRTREYESDLGELTQISSNESYSTYLTSYDSDGLSVNGFLTIPQGDVPDGGFPAVVFVHGYIPPKNYQTLTNYQSYVDYLAKEGFVVFKIDLRGNGNSEGEAGGSYFSGDYIVDTLNAHNALGNSDFVDEDRVGLWGHSMAGNIVSRALAAMPSIPAVAIWAGAVYTYEDFFENSIQDSSYQPPDQDSEVRKKRLELFEVNGNFDPDSEFWSKVPMTNYLDGITGAISLNHAVNDNVVTIEYSRDFNRILDGTNIKHELNEYPSGGHNITGSAFTQAMDNTVKFFNENL